MVMTVALARASASGRTSTKFDPPLTTKPSRRNSTTTTRTRGTSASVVVNPRPRKCARGSTRRGGVSPEGRRPGRAVGSDWTAPGRVPAMTDDAPNVDPTAPVLDAEQLALLAGFGER